MIAVALAAHRALAVEALTACAIDPNDAARVAWDNRPFAPAAGLAPWAVVTCTPGATVPNAEGYASLDGATWMPQLTLHVAPGKGLGELTRLVGLLEATYRIGRVVDVRSAAGARVGRATVRGFTPGPAVGGVVANWVACPCRATLDVVAGRPGLTTDPALTVRLPAPLAAA